MDSVDLNETGFNGEGSALHFQDALSPSDEALPPLPIQQYEDYLREVQDIRQSIIIKSQEEEYLPSNKNDSGDDPEEDGEADWLRLAGLSDLVINPLATTITDSPGAAPFRLSGGDLSSMTVLSTLTRPQREAVLRRITSFNRAQKSRRRPKPPITALFPNAALDVKSPTEDYRNTLKKPGDLALKSTILTQEDDGGYADGGYPRRHSESPLSHNKPGNIRRPLSPGSRSMDYGSKHKKNLESVIATNTSGGINPFILSSNEVELCSSFSSSLVFKSVSNPFTRSTSLPDLNNCDESNEIYLEKTCNTYSFSSNTQNTQSALPSVLRPHFVTSGRSMKALSDVPCSEVHCSSTANSSPARLLLKADGENVETKFTNHLSLSPEKDNVFTFVISPIKYDELDPISLFSSEASANISGDKRHLLNITTMSSESPESCNGSRLTLDFSTKQPSPPVIYHQMNRQSPSPVSPIKGRQSSKRSPLRKISSSFSSLRSSPVRTGSYRVKSSGTTRRRSLRRVRSLRSQKAGPVSLVSVKYSTSGDVQKTAKALSVETLSISPHNTEPASWNKDELSLQFTDDSGKTVPQAKYMSYSETAKQESLPNFSLVKDKLGITKISDLSAVDLRKVQTLAVIELAALFDLRGIDLKRRKLGKMKLKDNGVFGIPLVTLLDWDRKRKHDPQLHVPLVLNEIISFLEQSALKDEGILRKSGSAARTKMLKQEIENQFGINAAPDISPASEPPTWPEAYPNDVAAILKEFLRELPDPLLTTEYLEAFQSCGLITDRKEQLQALNLLIILLNEVHRDSLKLLLKFLGQVVASERWNKMSLNNVAMIIAPNLFLNKKSSKKETLNTNQDLKHAAGTSNIVRMLIKYHKLLWTIPAFMLKQVRLMNRAEMNSKKHNTTSKEKYKFFKGKAKDQSKKPASTQAKQQPFDYETPKGLIRVQAPNMKLTSMAVQLDDNLVAGDIISRYKRQCERMRDTGSDNDLEEITDATHALCEVGGNIHERCLDPYTNLSALISVNPDVSWFIRPRLDG